jgi:hypothetical protein
MSLSSGGPLRQVSEAFTGMLRWSPVIRYSPLKSVAVLERSHSLPPVWSLSSTVTRLLIRQYLILNSNSNVENAGGGVVKEDS